MFPVPSEFAIAEVYFPPLLVAAIAGLIAAVATAIWMNRLRLTRHLANPSLAFLAITAIYTVVIGTLFVGI